MSENNVINFLNRVLIADEDLNFVDTSQKESFRMYFYRLKRQWKNHNPMLFEKYKDVMVQQKKEHPTMLFFTIRGRQFADILAEYQTSDMDKEIDDFLARNRPIDADEEER